MNVEIFAELNFCRFKPNEVSQEGFHGTVHVNT